MGVAVRMLLLDSECDLVDERVRVDVRVVVPLRDLGAFGVRDADAPRECDGVGWTVRVEEPDVAGTGVDVAVGLSDGVGVVDPDGVGMVDADGDAEDVGDGSMGEAVSDGDVDAEGVADAVDVTVGVADAMTPPSA